MKKQVLTILTFALVFALNIGAQNYTDYLGAGHDEGITVYGSSEFENTSAANTINGGGLDARYMDAARFLSQTTFGGNMDEIIRTEAMGKDAWLQEQFNIPQTSLLDQIDPIWSEILELHEEFFEVRLAEGILEICEFYPDTSFTQAQVDAYYEEYIQNVFGPSALQFNYAWWHTMMTAPDQLRQRMAYALSQILVVSSQSDLGDHAEALAGYYDILVRNAFGNYRDILMEITLSPAMGYYLSHLNNPRAIPEENIHPDENYAREIMQLFSIGLYMLNQDGSRMQDAQGNDIPTYDNNDIKELAKIFTGLGAAELDPRMDIWWTDEAYFGLDLYSMHKWEPMKMYEEWHQPGQKVILKDLIIPAGQDGMTDIEMAVDYLFNHPNVGPFISRQLIQRFIKSNPTPEYISRVSAVFNDNGNGERGDMRAVLEAIIMDEEARSCEGFLLPENGKLKEPTLRHAQFSRIVPMIGRRDVYDVEITSYDCAGVTYNMSYEDITDDLRYWHNGYSNYQLLRQNTLMSPTVFNFYLPDHQPVGNLTQLGLVGPEYKIHDTGTAINYINLIFSSIVYEFNFYSYDGDKGVEYIMPEFDALANLASEDMEALVNYLDIVFTHGRMSDQTRENLRALISALIFANDPDLSAKLLSFFVLISPDYTIDK
ncbi:MAG: DUF1800 family protein [Saprospiraceae bacterium]|nr:DUF1800 family protein [Saprospiraceae bacterium]